MVTAAPHALCLDIGGSHVTAAPVDLARRAVIEGGRVRLALDHTREAAEIVSTWSDAITRAAQACPGVHITHMALALPAPFDYERGVSHMTHKYQRLLGLNVRSLLQAELRGSPLAAQPILLGNDADLFALGEHWAGAGLGYDRMIGLTLGTGLGSGFVAGGHVITSGRDVPPGGEIWQLPYGQATAETFASGAAVTRFYQALRGEHCGAHAIAQRADQGDEDAQQAFRQLGEHLAAIVSPIAQTFRADCVVIGGNVSRAWTHFSPALRSGLSGYHMQPSTLLEDAVLLGGAALRTEIQA